MNNGQSATVPHAARAADVPRHVQLVAGRIEGHAVSSFERAAILFRVERFQQGDDLPPSRLGVVLDDRRAC